MNEQLLWVIGVGLLAAVPGIAALVVGRHWVSAEGPDATTRADKAAQAALLSQLQEQVVTQQNTIRFLTARVDQLEKARAEEFAETESLREETESLRQEVRELRRGVQELTRQIEAAKLIPVWQPPASAVAGAKARKRTAADVPALRDRIAEHYSLKEIDDLAFRLHVEPDELEGETRPDRARNLVGYMKRAGRLDELVGQCRADRPDGEF